MSIINEHTLEDQYVHVKIHDLDFCISVNQVQDVINTPNLTKVPLATDDIAGLMNLRGRVVTAIDMEVKLGLKPVIDREHKGMSVIIEIDGELYGLLVSRVGEVVHFNKDQLDKNPSAIDPNWHDFSLGVCLFEKRLFVLLDVYNLMGEIK